MHGWQHENGQPDRIEVTELTLALRKVSRGNRKGPACISRTGRLNTPFTQQAGAAGYWIDASFSANKQIKFVGETIISIPYQGPE